MQNYLLDILLTRFNQQKPNCLHYIKSRLPLAYLLASTAVLFSPAVADTIQPPNTKDHYDYTVDPTTLEADYLEYTGAVPDTILIEGDGTTIVDGNGHQGFHFEKLTNSTTITVRDIAEFKGFVSNTDGEISTPEGGAAFHITANATLNFEGYDRNNRLKFNGQSTSSDGNDADGAGIAVHTGGVVGDIYADFSNNKATFSSTLTEVAYLAYARGAAIYVEGVGASMGKVYGNFTNNTAEFGGAVYVGNSGNIGAIEGVFKNNHAESSLKDGAYTGGAAGGAIRFYKATMSAIKGDFIGNTVHAIKSVGSTAQGGAIALNGASFQGGKGYIEGNFRDNISFSDLDNGLGGAFHLIRPTANQPLYFIDTNVQGNMAGTASTTAKALGGAFYIELADSVFIDARSKDVVIRDNYEVVGGTWDNATRTVTGGVRDYNAIYAKNSTINLRAQNSTSIVDGEEVITGHKITIDDSIESEINSNLILDSTSILKYDVEINAEIRNMNVTVNEGGLILGSYEHKYTETIKEVIDGETVTEVVHGQIDTHGSFKGGTLSISEAGLVNTKGENISSATSITNEGIIEFMGGTLSQHINSSGAKTGDLYILDETTVTSNKQVYADNVVMDDILKITEGATVDVNTLLYEGVNMHEINGHEQIVLNPSATLDFDTVRLEIDSATYLDYFDLIISDGTGYVQTSFDQTYNVEFYLGGELLTLNTDYIIQMPDSNGGLRILFIPEPSTATLSLLSLAGLLARRRRKAAHESVK